MIISIFDQSHHLAETFKNHGYKVLALDITTPKNPKTDFTVTNILHWDYSKIDPKTVSFLFIALPCQTYSIASGGQHFKNSKILTASAVNSVNILIKIYQITQYFNCPFMIENPAGGLVNNKIFKSFFNLNITRVTLQNFGFPTQKKTDLFYNFDGLFIVPVTYRKNGVYNKIKLDNLSYKKRVTYPKAFCEWLVFNLKYQIKLY